ncbi:MAG: DUF1016 N-terminal domain-containing protein [Candidatus Latescibacterota bacterium]|nr:DUF1016 N-terminal domain-containing protein [Candidatus Latescibacterota bacterium]
MATAEEQLVAAAQIVNSQSDQGERKARAYWELGRLIHEQLGPRSGYGQDSIGSLAHRLHLHTRTLYRARRFYQRLPNLTTWSGLTWSHCRVLATLTRDDDLLRLLDQTRAHRWSVRHLQAQVRQCEKSSALTPRRGRPWTYQLLPGHTPTLDLGFHLQMSVASLGPISDRTQRLLNTTGSRLLVELSPTPQGIDLRPVWGTAHQRLYAYPLRDAQALSAHQLTGVAQLLPQFVEPQLEQRLQLTLRGIVPASTDDGGRGRLKDLLQGRRLAITVDHPGPPADVDLFGHDDSTAEAQQVIGEGHHINGLIGAAP